MSRTDNRGGRRNGAGRHPGAISFPQSTTLRASQRAQDKTPTAVALADLPAPIQLAVKLHCRGWTNVAIADRLGKDRETIGRWLRGNPDAIAQELETIVSPVDTLGRLVPKAGSTIDGLMEEGVDPRVRLGAANTVYDRVYGKPIVREERHERRDIAVVFIDAQDEIPHS